MKCKGSSTKRVVSDYNVIVREARCPFCNRKVKITIPDKKMHCNTAKYMAHSVLEK
jgi:hypothetical protein